MKRYFFSFYKRKTVVFFFSRIVFSEIAEQVETRRQWRFSVTEASVTRNRLDMSAVTTISPLLIRS